MPIDIFHLSSFNRQQTIDNWLGTRPSPAATVESWFNRQQTTFSQLSTVNFQLFIFLPIFAEKISRMWNIYKND